VAIGRIISRMGLTTRKLLPRAVVLPWADQRTRHQERLSVASVLSMLSEVVRKFVQAGLFAKIRLTNGRLAEYYDSVVVCISEEVPTGFHYSKGRTDGQSREYVWPDYPKRVMEFGLCLSRLFEHRFY